MIRLYNKQLKISEIKWDTGRKFWFFHTPPAFDAPIWGSASEYCHVWYRKSRMVDLPDGEIFFKIAYSFQYNARTWQMDGRTLHKGIGCAMHSVVQQENDHILYKYYTCSKLWLMTIPCEILITVVIIMITLLSNRKESRTNDAKCLRRWRGFLRDKV